MPDTTPAAAVWFPPRPHNRRGPTSAGGRHRGITRAGSVVCGALQHDVDDLVTC